VIAEQPDTIFYDMKTRYHDIKATTHF